MKNAHWPTPGELVRTAILLAAALLVLPSTAVAAPGPDLPTVRFVYLVPSDRPANLAYVAAIESAARNVQRWMQDQLGGATFRLHSTPVDVYRTNHPEAYYVGDGAPGFGFWSRGVVDGFAATGGRSDDADALWIFYLDAQNGCGQNGGAGALGVALMARDDLDGLLSGKPYDRCGEYYPLPLERWIGGLGHELGHALGLPHPPGCDARAPGCDGGALMWSGYARYPDTYLRSEEKAQLASSRFISAHWTTLDTDADGLPDEWEVATGLDRRSGMGSDGSSGDPDGDGVTNAAELASGTHPRGFFTRLLAEGASNSFFKTRIALLNPTTHPAKVLVRFLTAGGTTVRSPLVMPAGSQRTVDPGALGALERSEFSTIVESDQLVVTERTMMWDQRGYGAHAEAAVQAPERTWYVAEGSTAGRFDLFYLIQNPGAAATTVTVTYLRPAPYPPIVRPYHLAPHSRFTIWVNHEEPALASTDVSAVITSTEPVVVERAMYISGGGLPFQSGHAGAAVTRPALEWFLAEGATGAFFDLFVLIANPSDDLANVTATFLLPGGATVTKSHAISARSRYNIWVDKEDARLADSAVSTIIRSDRTPIVVERSMWWPGRPDEWTEAHSSAGATHTGTRWAMAEGELGGPSSSETYILVANTSASEGMVRATLLFDDGQQVSRSFQVAATSRFNIAVASEFPEARGRRFGAVIESLGPSPIQTVVERAMYFDADGVPWAAGTNALATRLH